MRLYKKLESIIVFEEVREWTPQFIETKTLT